MQSCDHIRARLDDWLDDALSPAEQTTVERHLAECTACQSVFEREESLGQGLAALGRAADRMAGAPSAVEKRVRSLGTWKSAAVIALALGAALLTRGFWWPNERPMLVETVQPPSGPSVTNTDVNARNAAPSYAVEVGETQFAVAMKSNDPAIHIVWVYQDQINTEEAPVDAPSNRNR